MHAQEELKHLFLSPPEIELKSVLFSEQNK